MAVWSEISLAEIEGAGRLDAEYYQPVFIKERAALRALPHVRLGDVAYVTDGQHGYHLVDPESDIKHITAKCVTDNIVVADDADRLAIETHLKNMRSSLEVGDVLLQTAGTIGSAGVVTEDILPANIDQDVARICIHDKTNLSPWYVSVFINSELGRMQAAFESTGQVQKHLSLGAVRKLIIPLLPQQNAVAKIAIQSYERRLQSNQFYAEAENLLLHELGLDTLDLSHELTYERNFSEVATADRIDAQHYQPKFYRVHDAIASLKPKATVPLESLLVSITNGQTPLRHDLSEGDIPFLTAEHVLDFRIDYESDKRVLASHHVEQLKRTQLSNKDVLVTIKGRIGNVAVVENLPRPTNINQDVALIRLRDEIHPYYIAGFLNSAAGKALTEQVCTGQINPFLGLGNLKSVMVPLFDEQYMSELGDKIQSKVAEAYQTHEDANQLLEDAKRRVEQMILGEEASHVA